MRFLILLVASATLVVIGAVPTLHTKSPEWVQFKSSFRKKYRSTTEEFKGLSTYANKLSQVERHNKRFAKRQESYSMGINKYSDVPNLERVQTMNGYTRHVRIIKSKACSFMIPVETPTTVAPITPPTMPNITSAAVDWRTEGAVSSVKDQEYCGSCWTFSATGALEAQNFFKTGRLVPLSQQNLMDCATTDAGYSPNDGCSGGWMGSAFDYVKNNGGIDTEESYPYLIQQQPTCNYNPVNSGGTCSGYVDLPSGNETALMEAVRTIGPISVAIDASKESFANYKSGVYYDRWCSSTSLDHGVLVVGYGTDPIGGDYWIVKNSWGTSYGEQGYVRMARNRNNHCGIASAALYPKA